MSLNEKFEVCAEKVRKFSKRPVDSDLLELYSLYKQATTGDCNRPKPNEETAKSKWEAWNKKKGISQNDAKTAYINKTNELAPKYT